MSEKNKKIARRAFEQVMSHGDLAMSSDLKAQNSSSPCCAGHSPTSR
jgi:hypothetical protein